MSEELKKLVEDCAVTFLKNAQYEGDSQKRGDLLADAGKLLDRLSDDKKLDIEAEDKECQRILEEMKNNDQTEIEREKLKISWKKMLPEMIKIFGPALLSFMAYDVFQKRVLYFEEHGRISSTAGRELHLPKFLTR